MRILAGKRFCGWLAGGVPAGNANKVLLAILSVFGCTTEGLFWIAGRIEGLGN